MSKTNGTKLFLEYIKLHLYKTSSRAGCLYSASSHKKQLGQFLTKVSRARDKLSIGRGYLEG
jgi:hypothetical protein